MSVNMVNMLTKDTAKALATAGRKVDEWTAERNRLIVEAHEAGASTRDIADVLSITHTAVWKIINR